MKRLFLILIFVLLGVTAVYRGAWAESLLFVSDLHLTEEAAAFAPALNAVRQTLQAHDAMVLLGDNTNNGKMAEHLSLIRWLTAVRLHTGKAVYVIPGNHDLSPSVPAGEFGRLYATFGLNRAFSRDTASQSCAVMTGEGTCLLLLDTNACDDAGRVLPNGGVRAETAAWLDETLSSLPQSTPVIACGHHPLLPETRIQATRSADTLAQVLKRHRVSVYLCGHDHGFATVDDPALRQITVGQPHAYPGWCGLLQRLESGLSWRTLPLYDFSGSTWQKLRQGAETLAYNMARGTLRGTVHEGDEDAVRWFAKAFLLYAGGEMTPGDCSALLRDENAQKWREIETRTVVKSWIFHLLEHCPPDVRSISLPFPE